MKHKSFKILFIFLLTLFTASCESKQERLKNQYIEACADGDFEKARAAATKLEAENDWAARDAIMYINDKEIYSLLAKPSRDNDSRILFLYNTYESDQLPDMEDVLEVAISMGNENLPEKLIKAGVYPKSFKIIEAAINVDNMDLVKILIKKQPEAISNDGVISYISKEFGDDVVRETFNSIRFDQYDASEKVKFAEQALKYEMNDVVDKVIRADYSIASNSPNLQDYVDNNPNLKQVIAVRTVERLKKSLVDLKKSAPTFHSEGIVEFYDGYYYSHEPYLSSDKPKYKMPKENEAIAQYNKKVLSIYSEALKLNRKDIALDALNTMKPTIEAYSGHHGGEMIRGYKVDGNHYLIYHNYDEINKLKKELHQ